MKQIYESKERGWVNFGTVDQKYVIPFKICIGSTGKVWMVYETGNKTLEKSIREFYQTKNQVNNWTPKPMTEKEAIEIYCSEVN